MYTQKEENSQKNNATNKFKFKKMCVFFGTFLSGTNPTLQPSRVVIELEEEEGTICCHVRHTK
jgi:hypothetical protein